MNKKFRILKEMMNAIGIHVSIELTCALESVNKQIAELTVFSEEAVTSIKEDSRCNNQYC